MQEQVAPALLGHHQHLDGVGVDLCPGGEGQVAGLVGLGWLPWQAQLGHRLSQGCQPAPRAAARQHSWPAGKGRAKQQMEFK